MLNPEDKSRDVKKGPCKVFVRGSFADFRHQIDFHEASLVHTGLASVDLPSLQVVRRPAEFVRYSDPSRFDILL